MDEQTKAMIKDMIKRGADGETIQAITGASQEDINRIAAEGKQGSLLDRLGIVNTAQASEMMPIEDLRTMPLGTQETFGEKLKPTIPTGGSIFTNRFENFNPRIGETGIQQVVSPYNFTGFNEDVLDEEEDAQYNLPEKSSIFSNILDSGLNYAKDIGGRYIASKALSGAGKIVFGIPGAIAGTIGGLLGGGDLFNQNTYSQQMYNNLTPEGKAYASNLYGPGGVLQGYNQFSAFGRGTLGTIGNILSKNPNMSPTRRSAFLKAADSYISGIDPTQQGIAAVTKPGTYSYDDSIINYAPPSGGDSGGWSGGSGSDWGSGFDSDQATL